MFHVGERVRCAMPECGEGELGTVVGVVKTRPFDAHTTLYTVRWDDATDEPQEDVLESDLEASE